MKWFALAMCIVLASLVLSCLLAASIRGEDAKKVFTKEDLIKKLQKASPPLTSAASIMQSIATASNNQKFAIEMIKKLNGVLVNLGPAMVIAGLVLSMALAFLPKEDSAELKFMKDKFDLTINGISRLERGLGDLERTMVFEHAKTVNGEYERIIDDLYRNWQSALNSSVSGDDEEEKASAWVFFAEQYTARYKEAATNLYKSMSSKFSGHLNRDMLQASRDKFKCNALSLRSLCAAVAQVILKGISIEGAYYAYKKRFSHAEREAENWQVQMKDLGDSCEKIVDGCAADWRTFAEPLFKETYEKYKTADKKELSEILFNTMSNALPQRTWYTIVYQDGVGYKYHAVLYSKKEDIMMEWHKNDMCVTVYSTDLNDIRIEDFSKQNQYVEDLSKRIRGCDKAEYLNKKDLPFYLAEELNDKVGGGLHGIYVLRNDRQAYVNSAPNTTLYTRTFDSCDNRKEKYAMQYLFMA